MAPPENWGRREKRFAPSQGQTGAGVFLCGLAALGAFCVAAFGDALDTVNRVCAVLLGGIAIGIGCWIWSQRGWWLEMHEGGVIQSGEAIAWKDVRYVIETRYRAFNEPIIRITLLGSGGRLAVSPINTRAKSRIFELLLAAARSRNIPVKLEWEEAD
jgi:hypothetical protein